MNTKAIFTGIIFSAAACSAQAGVIIESIDVKMGYLKYENKVGLGDADDAFDTALNTFNALEDFYCDQELDAFTGISSQGTCGGSNQNFGSLYTITGSITGKAEFEFGLDWGFGGFVVQDWDGTVSRDSSDIWWSKNWNHGDVLSFDFEDVDNFSLTLLGFEGCCDGINSARYREYHPTFLKGPSESSRVDTPGTWNDLAVNQVADVPTPASLPLMGLGALLMYGARRRRAKA